MHLHLPGEGASSPIGFHACMDQPDATGSESSAGSHVCSLQASVCGPVQAFSFSTGSESSTNGELLSLSLSESIGEKDGKQCDRESIGDMTC